MIGGDWDLIIVGFYLRRSSRDAMHPYQGIKVVWTARIIVLCSSDVVEGANSHIFCLFEFDSL